MLPNNTQPEKKKLYPSNESEHSDSGAVRLTYSARQEDDLKKTTKLPKLFFLFDPEFDIEDPEKNPISFHSAIDFSKELDKKQAYLSSPRKEHRTLAQSSPSKLTNTSKNQKEKSKACRKLYESTNDITQDRKQVIEPILFDNRFVFFLNDDSLSKPNKKNVAQLSINELTRQRYCLTYIAPLGSGHYGDVSLYQHYGTDKYIPNLYKHNNESPANYVAIKRHAYELNKYIQIDYAKLAKNEANIKKVNEIRIINGVIETYKNEASIINFLNSQNVLQEERRFLNAITLEEADNISFAESLKGEYVYKESSSVVIASEFIFCEVDSKKELASEKLISKSLKDFLKKVSKNPLNPAHQSLGEELLVGMILESFLAHKQLHEKHVVHLDSGARNFMVKFYDRASPLSLILIDFGLSTTLDDDLKASFEHDFKQKSIPLYLPMLDTKTVIAVQEYNKKVKVDVTVYSDLFALRCLIIEMLGRFMGMEPEVIFKINKIEHGDKQWLQALKGKNDKQRLEFYVGNLKEHIMKNQLNRKRTVHCVIVENVLQYFHNFIMLNVSEITDLHQMVKENEASFYKAYYAYQEALSNSNIDNNSNINNTEQNELIGFIKYFLPNARFASVEKQASENINVSSVSLFQPQSPDLKVNEEGEENIVVSKLCKTSSII